MEVEQYRYQMRYMVPRTMLEQMTQERDRLTHELHNKTTAYRVLTLKYEKAFADLNKIRQQESQRTPRPDWDAWYAARPPPPTRAQPAHQNHVEEEKRLKRLTCRFAVPGGAAAS